MYRKIVEKAIGRFLKPSELVHHIDGNRKNNELLNLEILTRSEHAKIHWAETRSKILAAANKARLGTKHSSEAIEKIRQKAIGRKLSLETRKKMSRTHTGMKHQPESIEKIRKAKIGNQFARKLFV